MIPMEWCKLIIVPFVLVITACTIDENNIASDTGTSLAIETDVETGIVVDTGDTDTTVSAELENIGSIEVTWDDLADNEEGFITVILDEKSVGQFAGFYQGETLAQNQVKMQYRVRDGNVKFATNAFFFQEGTAHLYEQARYGEFRVASNGELLLNNLRDKDYKVLGYNQP